MNNNKGIGYNNFYRIHMAQDRIYLMVW